MMAYDEVIVVILFVVFVTWRIAFYFGRQEQHWREQIRRLRTGERT